MVTKLNIYKILIFNYLYYKQMIRAVILLGGPSKKASYGAYE